NQSATGISAGANVSFTVTAKDSGGNTLAGYTGTVQLTSTDPGATLGAAALPASYTFVRGDAGSHVFTVTLKTAGSRTITVTDQATTTLTAVTSPITVAAGAVSKFKVSAAACPSIFAGHSFLFT